jgi:hypothetical protein
MDQIVKENLINMLWVTFNLGAFGMKPSEFAEWVHKIILKEETVESLDPDYAIN